MFLRFEEMGYDLKKWGGIFFCENDRTSTYRQQFACLRNRGEKMHDNKVN